MIQIGPFRIGSEFFHSHSSLAFRELSFPTWMNRASLTLPISGARQSEYPPIIRKVQSLSPSVAGRKEQRLLQELLPMKPLENLWSLFRAKSSKRSSFYGVPTHNKLRFSTKGTDSFQQHLLRNGCQKSCCLAFAGFECSQTTAGMPS
jgi:hypothetical protein